MRNPGLRALLDVAGFYDGARPSARQVAFHIAPRINAAGRMARANAVIEMFLTADPERARAIAQQLHDFNGERQQTEAEITRRFWSECARSPIDDADARWCSAAKAGIAAWWGSSRAAWWSVSPPGVRAGDRRMASRTDRGAASGRFICWKRWNPCRSCSRRFGGHQQAAGVTLVADRIPEFRARFNEYAGGGLIGRPGAAGGN